MDSSDALGDLRPLIHRLVESGENDRYRMLANILSDLAGRPSAADGRFIELTSQIDGFNKKVRRLDEERALLTHEVDSLKADLEQQRKLLETEQARAAELARINQSLKSRQESVQKERDELEERVVAQNTQLLRAENETESLKIKLDRAQAAAGDMSRVTKLEADKNLLAQKNAEEEAERERFRVEKEAEIARLKAALRNAQEGDGASSERILAALWARLQTAKPPFLQPPIPMPTLPAAERLVDGFVELVRFAAALDESTTLFFKEYVRRDKELKGIWEDYRVLEGVEATARLVIAPTGGKPANFLRIRLGRLKNLSVSAMFGADLAMAHLPELLDKTLRGPMGTERDKERKIRMFLQEGGHEGVGDAARNLMCEKIRDSIGGGL